MLGNDLSLLCIDVTAGIKAPVSETMLREPSSQQKPSRATAVASPQQPQTTVHPSLGVGRTASGERSRVENSSRLPSSASPRPSSFSKSRPSSQAGNVFHDPLPAIGESVPTGEDKRIIGVSVGDRKISSQEKSLELQNNQEREVQAQTGRALSGFGSNCTNTFLSTDGKLERKKEASTGNDNGTGTTSVETSSTTVGFSEVTKDNNDNSDKQEQNISSTHSALYWTPPQDLFTRQGTNVVRPPSRDVSVGPDTPTNELGIGVQSSSNATSSAVMTSISSTDAGINKFNADSKSANIATESEVPTGNASYFDIIMNYAVLKESKEYQSEREENMAELRKELEELDKENEELTKKLAEKEEGLKTMVEEEKEEEEGGEDN